MTTLARALKNAVAHYTAGNIAKAHEIVANAAAWLDHNRATLAPRATAKAAAEAAAMISATEGQIGLTH